MDQSGPAPGRTPGPEESAKPPFLPATPLPKGGGAIRGIGEKLSVNPARGTCSLAVPVYTTPGRAGFGPQLALGYDSGSGNSMFGMGWNMGVPAIGRKTDKGIPRYGDADTFVLSGGEDLVPSSESIPDEVIDGVSYHIRRYRPRTETTFTRIEHLSDPGSGHSFWRSVSPANVRSVYGRTARIADPADSKRVFQWLLEEVRDDRGNVATYEYLPEPAPATADAWERNRLGLAQPQRYLHRVRYCEHFVVELEYEPRPDPFSSCRSGFEVRTWQRCRRVAMYHDFPAEFAADGGPNPRLVRSTELSYEDDPAGVQLRAVTQTGQVWDAGGYIAESLPPIEFEYTMSTAEDVVRTVEVANLPSGVDSRAYLWVDLDGEGLPGALTQQGAAWFYKRNLGNGALGALEHVPLQPSISADGGSVALVDIGGDGARALVRQGPVLRGYQERSDAGGWADFQPFKQDALVQGDLKYVDLNGDGLSDVLLLAGEELRHHLCLGRDGYDGQQRTLLGSDEERGPVLVRSDASESILLADMSGDGLADLVRVRNSSICYWPNLGHGRFGTKVTMATPPNFDHPDLFEPSRIRPADIDGSGTTDLLYLGRDEVSYWFNRAGNSFGERMVLRSFPDTDDLAIVDVVDLLGTGTSCLVWSSSNVFDRESPLRYVDLSRAVSTWLPESQAPGHKPHLLCQVTNNMGAQTRLIYASSTRFYLADRAAGMPWATRLHFPVQVVSRVETYDHVAKTRLVSGYRYRHGYYDGPEREFRGFGMVEQNDAETFPLFAEPGLTELHRPPARTRSWFHLGTAVDVTADYQAFDPLLATSSLPAGLTPREHREALRALAGLPLRTEVYADDGDPNAGVPYSVVDHRYQVELVQSAQGEGHAVFRHHPLETLTHHYERNAADPRIGHELVLKVDQYNTVLRSVAIGYPRRTAEIPEQELIAVVRKDNDVTHVTAGAAYRLAVPIETLTYELTMPAAERYTIADFAVPGIPEKLLEHTRMRYWNDDLTSELPAKSVGSRALVHQSYQLALTPGLVQGIFAGRVDSAMLAEAGYHLADGGWWIPSGVQHLDPASFYLPSKLVSPFGNESSVEYDPYRLLPVASHASQVLPYNKLVSQSTHDYRLLAPREVTDPHGNRTRAAFDVLGRVIATWVIGKTAGEGDPDDLPGAEFSYGADSWHSGDGPVWALARTREQHGAVGGPWQTAKAYSDGLGRIVMTKQQTEPGDDGLLRWIGSGRVVYDNKGKPVKQYEPYFSPTADYEDEPDIVEQGVTPILFYDPIGRLIRTKNPDETLSRVVIGPWTQESWDANDTVLDSLWYAERGSPDPDDPEPVGDPQRRAAWLAAQHADTPAVSRMDSLGRAVRAIGDAGPLGLLETVSELDIEGNTLSVTDPRDVVVLTQDVDLAGRALHTFSPDAGDRWTLVDVAGTPVRSWDDVSTVHREYDLLRRPIRMTVTPDATPDESRVVEAVWYGEAHPSALPRNLLGRAVIMLDQSGFTHAVEHDFKGNLRVARRRLTLDPLTPADWSGLSGIPVNGVETAANPKLDPEVQQSATEFDALSRPTVNILPDGTITTPSYNEGGTLETVRVNPIGPMPEDFYVRDLDYDAKGQRQLIVYGNFVRTKYTYDRLTFRLVRMETWRSGAPDERLQDLHYTYDPVGNITEVRDDAQQTHFYAGQVTTPSTRYSYDALYRLTSASGREHDSLGNQPDNVEPSFGKPIPHPNDATKVRPYTQSYVYDKSGNIRQMKHVAGSGSWTRDYDYAAGSNRLLSHTWPHPNPATFGYDEHGNMTTMPHLSQDALTWDYADRLATVDLIGGGIGHYLYDASGQRTRKVLQRLGGTVEERIYLGAYEIHRKYVNGIEVFKRTTVHVMDDTRRIGLIEHKTVDNGPVDEVRVRYQLGNHLGSCSLEVSAAAEVISYEEYHPYGTTSLWLGHNDIEVSDRRYRYTGKEKDEETGLYYHGARYYAPWLARWTAADPIGLADGTNVYAYVRKNPIRLVDPSGTQSQSAKGGVTVSPNSRVSAQQWVEMIQQSKSLEPWMKAMFAAKDNRIVLTGSNIPLPKDMKPEQIPEWFRLALLAIKEGEWRITTGASIVSDSSTKIHNKLIPDSDQGDSPAGTSEVPPRQDGKPAVVVGETIASESKHPRESMLSRRMLDTNAGGTATDTAGRRAAVENKSGQVVKPAEGLVVVADRFRDTKDVPLDVLRGKEAMLETFFHELAAHGALITKGEFGESEHGPDPANAPITKSDHIANDVRAAFGGQSEDSAVKFARDTGSTETLRALAKLDTAIKDLQRALGQFDRAAAAARARANQRR